MQSQGLSKHLPHLPYQCHITMRVPLTPHNRPVTRRKNATAHSRTDAQQVLSTHCNPEVRERKTWAQVFFFWHFWQYSSLTTDIFSLLDFLSFHTGNHLSHFSHLRRPYSFYAHSPIFPQCQMAVSSNNSCWICPFGLKCASMALRWGDQRDRRWGWQWDSIALLCIHSSG